MEGVSLLQLLGGGEDQGGGGGGSSLTDRRSKTNTHQFYVFALVREGLLISAEEDHRAHRNRSTSCSVQASGRGSHVTCILQGEKESRVSAVRKGEGVGGGGVSAEGQGLKDWRGFVQFQWSCQSIVCPVRSACLSVSRLSIELWGFID